MKTICLSIVLGFFFIPLFAQEPELGLPGDNLNLYGVLNIFQNSPTLEEFEKNLNAEDSKVNNLDLNGDGNIDYIHVIDNMNGSAHAIALRVDINESETQDVAVIEVEKDAHNSVHVQIVGDEALYGKDYIVEPRQNTPNPGYRGNVTEPTPYYSPATWAIIGFMFMPRYVVYNSPYHWGYYPHYWHPWRPFSYHEYYGFHRPYYHYYSRSYIYRSPAAHAYYAPHRVSSVIVRERYSSPGTNHSPRPINNSSGKINQSPHPVKTIPEGTNQKTRTINNTPGKTNQSPHKVNNQPSKINQSPHKVNNQPSKINQSPHKVNNQPSKINQSSHPVKNNTVKKK